ncbi:MAG: diguanylate cyclase/phosphodiesterase with sensor [Solirubrobacterales bacterium]|nr:diguanylate cyclase/phosphodiesterase with sensor [Solirubrobacterales bacterium]
MSEIELEPGLDPSELRFRLDSVPAGAWVTFIVCFAGLGYVLGWDHPHDDVMAVLFGTGALGGGVMYALPWERIVRSRYREVVFTAWSAIDLGLIIGLAALQGGGDSVFVSLMVIPIVFAAVSYPRALVIGISVTTVAAYLGLAAATHTPGEATLMYATTLGCTALMCVWQARNHERRRELLAIASRTDPLTAALNRRGFQQAAGAMLAGVTRLGYPASLVLLDLDNFKQFNDSHGHAAGDELLCWTVERIRASLRPTDSLARLGGDEFAVLLAGADRPAAQKAVQRITEDLSPRVVISCGLASAPSDGDDIDALYRRADTELYEAKRARTGGGVVSHLRV